MAVTKEDINRLKEIFITREECTESIRNQMALDNCFFAYFVPSVVSWLYFLGCF